MAYFQTIMKGFFGGLILLASFHGSTHSRAETTHGGLTFYPSNSLKSHPTTEEYNHFQLYDKARDGCSITDPRCSTAEKL